MLTDLCVCACMRSVNQALQCTWLTHRAMLITIFIEVACLCVCVSVYVYVSCWNSRHPGRLLCRQSQIWARLFTVLLSFSFIMATYTFHCQSINGRVVFEANNLNL